MSGYANIPSSFPSQNILYDAASGKTLIANQNALLVNQGATQDLADRATLRGLAPGLATGDPNATAGAAVLPGIGGTLSVGAMTSAGELGVKQQELAFKLAQLRGAAAGMDSIYPGKSQGSAGGGTTGAGQQAQDGSIDAFEHQMGPAEAKNPSEVNAGGYIGQFQFGAPRLAELGMYKPAPGEDVKANKFGGTFDIPGFPDVKTKADFLTGKDAVAAQHAAFGIHVRDIDQTIADTPGADQFDHNGLRAVAHLGGNDGMRKFVATAGGFNPGDNPNAPGGGTHLSDYYTRFGAHGAPALQAKFGSPHGPAGPPQAPGAAPGTPAPYQVAGPPVAPPGAGGGVPFGPPVNGQPPLPLPARPTAGPPGTPGAAAPDLTGPRPLPPTGPGSPVATPASIANTPAPIPATPLNNQAIVGQPADSVAGAPPQALAPAPEATPQAMPAGPVAPSQQSSGGAPSGFQPARGDAAQPQAPITDSQNLTAADHTALEGMKQSLKATLNPNGPQLLQAEIDKRQAANRALSVAAWNAANPNIRATPVPGNDKDGNPGSYMVQGTRIVGFIPAQSRPATGSYDIAKAALAADQPKIDAITAGGQASQSAMLRLNEMADIIPRLATGPSGELRTKGAAWLEQLGASPATIQRYTGMESGSLAEELIKLSIATAGQAAKTDVGANNGIQSLQLYQNSNPGMALLPDANKKMTNMLRVSQQMSQDYTNGALEHFNPQQKAIMHGGTEYSPISEYNQQWQQRNNPQIGAAAMGILNGDPFAKWSARVSPAEATAATAMAARIDPNVTVPTRSGTPVKASDILAHPALPTPP